MRIKFTIAMAAAFCAAIAGVVGFRVEELYLLRVQLAKVNLYVLVRRYGSLRSRHYILLKREREPNPKVGSQVALVVPSSISTKVPQRHLISKPLAWPL